MIFCNQEHMSIGYYSSYDNHSRIAKRLEFQIARFKKFYDALWQEIVKHKIANQTKVLQKLEKSEEVVKSLNTFMENVTEGDTTN